MSDTPYTLLDGETLTYTGGMEIKGKGWRNTYLWPPAVNTPARAMACVTESTREMSGGSVAPAGSIAAASAPGSGPVPMTIPVPRHTLIPFKSEARFMDPLRGRSQQTLMVLNEDQGDETTEGNCMWDMMEAWKDSSLTATTSTPTAAAPEVNPLP